ncbi:restriction endonuclease subunit S [Ligilactobacillus salivarius]|uniref:restriction endonuclease subunit S n=1 Tax=Ligilactobacillus salivarius TaxID=1624 RepID=UPI0011812256|nr:restriction endonuclease subunit S [Ligilactobacillus salivarius]
MDNKKNGIPKLRFPGFTGAWEQRKLGEVFNQTLVAINPEIENVELWSLTIEDGLTHKTARYNRQFLVKKEDNFKKVFPGDIVYNPMNMTLGAVGFNYMDIPVAVSGYYVTMQLNKNYDNCYFAVWLKSPIALSLYKRYATGSLTEKQRVQFSTLSTIPAVLPNYKEQQKIGHFFKQLDSLITLHQRKLEHLQEQKKGLLQKMFPKNGETVPEVRFPGFTDAWEQRKLGEIVEWSKGSGLSKDALNIQGIGVPVIHYADLYKFNSVQKEVIHWTMNNIGTKIPENNLLFPMSDVTPDGLARTSTVLQSNVKAGGDVLIAKLNKDILSTFMSYQINRNKNQILPLVTGTTVRHINSKSLSTLKVTVPGKNEQKYVGSILMRFDSLIALHQRKLEHLELMKKGLLQQMFV